MHTLKTFVSRVWSTRKNPIYDIDDKDIFALKKGDEQYCWFDELFKGGIVLPDGIVCPEGENQNWKRTLPPIIMLISGPPGIGKTTLALEICYRLAKNKQPGLPRNPRLSSIYISTESHARSIIGNAESFNWTEASSLIKDFTEFVKSPEHSVGIYGLEHISDLLDTSESANFVSEIANNITTQLQVLPKVPEIGAIVVDSLNVIPHASPVFERVYFDLKFILGAVEAIWCPYLLIVLLDEPVGSNELRFWEDVVDIAIRLNYAGERERSYKTFQIVKARYQPFEKGEHHLEVDTYYPKPPVEARYFEAGPRVEGGIFIYPSIQWHLSRARFEQRPIFKVRRAIPVDGNPEIAGLNSIIGEGEFAGIPEGGCTALIGRRGAQKSHLAYYFLLQNLSQNKRCLLITLRDDEFGAIRILEEIARQEGFSQLDFSIKPDNPKSVFSEDLLTIIYFWPGYLTPQQFLHRIFLALERGKKGDMKTGFDLIIVNGVDQLGARFPICAEEKMFIPSLLTMFRRKGITTIVIAAQEEVEESSQYGLLPMSDLVLRFDMYRVSATDYLKIVARFESMKSEKKMVTSMDMTGWQTEEVDGALKGERRCFVVEAMRVHWGQVGARRALIERVHTNGKEQMRIIPLPVDFPLGPRVEL